MTASTVNPPNRQRPTILGSEALTMKEAARACGVHVATLWRWHLHGVRGAKLDAQLVGGQRYVTRANLDAFLEAINRRAA